MDIRNLFFKGRSFTPIPILLMMLYFARPNSPYSLLGIFLIVIGEIIRLRSVSFAGGETRTMNVGASSICKSGPYSIVRNPLYIGNVMIYVGFAFVVFVTKWVLSNKFSINNCLNSSSQCLLIPPNKYLFKKCQHIFFIFFSIFNCKK